MEATVKRDVCDESSFGEKLGVQFKRGLLSIDEYAVREGVSRDIVEECGKLGIVQIRKCKGKKYVVDGPLSPYREGYAAKGAGVQSIDKLRRREKKVELEGRKLSGNFEEDEEAAKKELMRGAIEQMRESGGEVKSFMRSISTKDESVLRLPVGTAKDDGKERAKETVRSGRKKDGIVSGKKEPLGEIKKTMELPERIRTPELEKVDIGDTLWRADEAFKELEEAYETTDKLFMPIDELIELEETSEAIAAPQEKGQRDIFATGGGKIVIVGLLLFLIVAVLANFWFYMEQKVQLTKLESAYTRTQRVYGELANVKRRAGGLQEQLSGSKAEVEQIRSELNGVRREAESVRDKLRRIEESNSATVKRVNEQIRSFLAD